MKNKRERGLIPPSPGRSSKKISIYFQIEQLLTRISGRFNMTVRRPAGQAVTDGYGSLREAEDHWHIWLLQGVQCCISESTQIGSTTMGGLNLKSIAHSKHINTHLNTSNQTGIGTHPSSTNIQKPPLNLQI